MRTKWNLNVWGVRGSVPVPDAHFLAYGGNTSCISVDCGENLVIFDAGSGLVPLGDFLFGKGIKRADILLSHLHLDHMMGLFRFRLFYDPEAEIHLYGEAGKEKGLSGQLDTLIGPPLWPVALRDFPAHIEIHEIRPGQQFLPGGEKTGAGSVQISTLRGNHPDGSLLYRLETQDRSIVYALDCEMNEEMFHSLAEFSGGSDLIIWDANFTEKDRIVHKGWGHSSWEEGTLLCRRAGVKRILMTHYAPEYTDEFLKNEEKKAKQTGIECYFAKEGMVIEL